MAKKKDLIYLAVTPDADKNILYETKDIKEMARWAGASVSTIRASISRNYSGTTKGRKYLAMTPTEYNERVSNGRVVKKAKTAAEEEVSGHRLFMAVSPDEYELPLYVCDTMKELAEWAGLSYFSVASYINREDRGTTRGYKFVTVDMEKENDGEEQSCSNLGEVKSDT